MINKDPYARQKKHNKKIYTMKSFMIRKTEYEILNKNLKEKNINFRQLILNFLKEQGLFDINFIKNTNIIEKKGIIDEKND